MPNLDHDPKNPTDLLGRPIKVDDIVAWGITRGTSGAGICVARIDKIRFIRPAPPGNWRVVNVECPQHLAEDYTLRVQPLVSTGHITYKHKFGGKDEWRYNDAVKANPNEYETKPVTVKLVKNIVLLEPYDGRFL